MARDLLTESGRIFVQIGDENVHLVRCVLDEVFGIENFCTQIAYQKAPYATSVLLPPVFDTLLWYSKDRRVARYRQLFRDKNPAEIENTYRYRDPTAIVFSPCHLYRQVQARRRKNSSSRARSTSSRQFSLEDDA